MIFFNDISIEHFRGIDRLTISDFSDVNVLVGGNNVGKTSLLESLFMLTGMSNPMMPLRVNFWRGSGHENLHDVRYLFHNVNLNEHPTFSAHTQNGVRKLSLRPVLGMSAERSYGDSSVASQLRELHFDFEDSESGSYHSWIYQDAKDVLQQHLDETYQERIRCVYLSAARNDELAAGSFASLVKRQKKEILLEALRVFDDRITSIEALPDGLYIGMEGLSELLPMSMAGDGIRRVINILSSIASEEHQVVLIDEIDGGLHYSAHRKLWKTVLSYAKTVGFQLFVTTHNMETLQALASVMREELGDHIRVYNIARTQLKGIQAYTYTSTDLEQAVAHEIEIRR